MPPAPGAPRDPCGGRAGSRPLDILVPRIPFRSPQRNRRLVATASVVFHGLNFPDRQGRRDDAARNVQLVRPSLGTVAVKAALHSRPLIQPVAS